MSSTRPLRIFAAVALVLFAALVAAFFRDTPPPDDFDLVIPWPEVDDQANAFPDLLALKLNATVNAIAGGSPVDTIPPEHLALAETLAANPVWQFWSPAVGDYFYDYHDTKLRYLTALLEARATSARAAGEIVAATADSRRIILLGQRVRTAPSCAIATYELGCEIIDRGLVSLGADLERSSDPQLRAGCHAFLGAHPVDRATLANALRWNYQNLANHLPQFAKHQPSFDGILYRPNATLELLGEIFRELIGNLDRPPDDWAFRRTRAVVGWRHRPAATLLSYNAGGRFLLGDLAIPDPTFFDHHLQTESRHIDLMHALSPD